MFNRKLFISKINKSCLSQPLKTGYCLILQNNQIYVFTFHENQKCIYYPLNSPENTQEKILSDLTWDEAKQAYYYIKFISNDNLQSSIEKEKNSWSFKMRGFFHNLMK